MGDKGTVRKFFDLTDSSICKFELTRELTINCILMATTMAATAYFCDEKAKGTKSGSKNSMKYVSFILKCSYDEVVVEKG